MKYTFFLFILFLGISASAQDTLSITLENVNYPYPVKFLPVHTEGQDLRMAYMDVKPKNYNGKNVVLMHGKNFGGYYWGDVIRALTQKGYRVIVPDQLGFGKSSKAFLNYSFHQLAQFNRQMLDTLGISKAIVLGHSMGGMLATRFALMFPDVTEKLILEDPIGLEDYRTFVPFSTVEEDYKTELKKSAESTRKYYQSSYFVKWKPQYEELVRIASGVIYSADYPRCAMVAALTSKMIYEQPVVYEFDQLKVPTVLFVGKEDKTIVGKGKLNSNEQKQHGQYSILGKQTAQKIKNCRLIEFDGVGHIPHLEAKDQFLAELIRSF